MRELQQALGIRREYDPFQLVVLSASSAFFFAGVLLGKEKEYLPGLYCLCVAMAFHAIKLRVAPPPASALYDCLSFFEDTLVLTGLANIARQHGYKMY